MQRSGMSFRCMWAIKDWIWLHEHPNGWRYVTTITRLSWILAEIVNRVIEARAQMIASDMIAWKLGQGLRDIGSMHFEGSPCVVKSPTIVLLWIVSFCGN